MYSLSQMLIQAYDTQNVSIRSLMLLARMDLDQAAEALHVSPESIRRWERTGRPNPTASKLMAIYAGYVPWKKWKGWEVHNGLLFAPGQNRYGLTGNMIQNMIILREYNDTLESENHRLLAELENLQTRQRAPILRLVR